MNKIKRMFNRAVRSRKRVSPERLVELRQKCEREWLKDKSVIGIAQSDNGIVVYCNKAVGFISRIYPEYDNAFDAYTDSPLEVVYTEPFDALNWGGEDVDFTPPPPQNGNFEDVMSQITYEQFAEWEASVVPTARIRPIYGGLSVGHKDITCGTITMIVQDKDTKEKMILSNNHVLANVNKGKRGDEVLQPGPYPDGGTVEHNTVGYLERFVELKNGATVDCAVAKVVSDDIWRYGMLGLGDAWFVEYPKVGMIDEKFGRTTGFSAGTGIKSIKGTFKINYGDQTFTINDVFVSDIRSAGGDSGSPICERYTAKLIGVLFAGNGSLTLGCEAPAVFEQLNIEMVDLPYGLVLDLSHYNGHLTDDMLRNAKARGVQGIIFKMSEGDYYKDTEFENNVACAEAAGMPWTGYHWNKPSIPADAQFAKILKCLGNHVPSFQLMVDNEDKDDCNPDKITSVTLALLKLIDDHFKPLGYKPPIYYSRGSWHNPYTLRSSEWKTYPLNAARYYVDQVKYYDTDPYFPYDWEKASLWQCKADKDRLAKYFLGDDAPCKDVDVDYILDQAEFDSWLVHVPPGEDPEEPPEEPEEPPEEPGEPTLKTGIHFYGKTLVGLNVRNAPSTNGTKLGTMPAGTQFEWMEEVKDGNNLWLRMGWKMYCAKLHNGSTYVKYVTE